MSGQYSYDDHFAGNGQGYYNESAAAAGTRAMQPASRGGHMPASRGGQVTGNYGGSDADFAKMRQMYDEDY